jgi:chain length determinant protein tyrosine kinase EpsG
VNPLAERSNNISPLTRPAVAASRPRDPGAINPVALTELSPALLAAHDPDGAYAESLRALRSELILRWFSDCRTLAVVGANRDDGAAGVAANLAIVMARLGEQTLLIDADLRTPTLHELFGFTPAAGLSDLLQNRDLHDEALLRVPAIENLHVMCAGAVPSNPQELVSRASFIYLMKTLPDRFRSIIIATPPALAFADAQVVAARAQGCVLVTRRHRTRIADVQLVKSRLETGRSTLLGAVIQE